MIIQKLKLNLIPGGIRQIVKVSQYDDKGTYLEIKLYNGANVFNIPSGASVVIQGTKQDRTGFQYPCEYTGSIITVPVTLQMCAYGDEVETEISIAYNNEVKHTETFILDVKNGALHNNIKISETDIPLLNHLDQVAKNLDASMDEMRGLNESAAESKDSAAQSASEAEQSAQEAARSATDAANSATAAAESASVLGEMSGAFQIVSEDGHLYLKPLPGFGGAFAIVRSSGHMTVAYA